MQCLQSAWCQENVKTRDLCCIYLLTSMSHFQVVRDITLKVIQWTYIVIERASYA